MINRAIDPVTDKVSQKKLSYVERRYDSASKWIMVSIHAVLAVALVAGLWYGVVKEKLIWLVYLSIAAIWTRQMINVFAKEFILSMMEHRRRNNPNSREAVRRRKRAEKAVNNTKKESSNVD